MRTVAQGDNDGHLTASKAAHASAMRLEAKVVPVEAAATETQKKIDCLSPEMKATASDSRRARTRPAMTLSMSKVANGDWKCGVYLRRAQT